MKQNVLLEAALNYARKRWYIFPLHSVRDGWCSCSNNNCEDQGKHPRTLNGFKDSSIDEAKVKKWWTQWPDANIGIETGEKSNLSVSDMDPRHGGHFSIEEFEKPDTPTVSTGGGGEHRYHSYDPRVKTKIGIRPGIDIKSDGGYVVAPPSNHKSGDKYVWCDEDLPLADPPEWMFTQEKKRAEKLPEIIPEGQRNSMLASLAGSMRNRGVSQEAIEKALIEENIQKCIPPLDEKEVKQIAKSISLYNPGNPSLGSISGKKVEDVEVVEDDLCLLKKFFPQVEFPLDVFPVYLDIFIKKVAKSFNVCPSVVASICLTVVSAALGNSIKILPKSDWEESPFLWLNIVGRSGSAKSPLIMLLYYFMVILLRRFRYACKNKSHNNNRTGNTKRIESLRCKE